MPYTNTLIIATMNLKHKFGKNVAFYRAQRSITQDELAERVHCTVETISNIERGLQGPRFDLIEQLAAELRCEVFELFVFD
ncbi:helix-turn-helix domain-containing protein [Dasania marina]|uniref:helix-turn-helix domain-containing protein n=1 Tax=Dasania marina TaxID=471499 RepID=UPI0003772A67